MKKEKLLDLIAEIASATAQGLNSSEPVHHEAALNDIQGMLLKAGLSES